MLESIPNFISGCPGFEAQTTLKHVGYCVFTNADKNVEKGGYKLLKN